MSEVNRIYYQTNKGGMTKNTDFLEREICVNSSEKESSPTRRLIEGNRSMGMSKERRKTARWKWRIYNLPPFIYYYLWLHGFVL
jgi:hypothetical protein